MFFRILCLLFVSLFIVSGCKSKRPAAVSSRPKLDRPARVVISQKEKPSKPVKTTTTASVPYNQQIANYIAEFSGIAKDNMVNYGIPASITLAQGILESGAGLGRLAQEGNNHFGIKCHREWRGGRIYHDDDERGECFRRYNDAAHSYRDHSLFLTERSRYRDLFDLPVEDYRAWARGLRKAGYATDPKYPDKLIGIIERYQLHQYDSEVLGNSSPAIASTPRQQAKAVYSVQQGDTLYSISRRFNLSVEDLKQYNNLSSNDISIGQTLQLEP